jgi:hypothetical protein
MGGGWGRSATGCFSLQFKITVGRGRMVITDDEAVRQRAVMYTT